jgi:CheY-like chemotaxis protein
MDKLLSGRRVLVVEDEMLVLIMIEDMLADLGCKSVTSAATIDKALALIDAQAFDFAMLDINLNGRDSHPVAEALSARGELSCVPSAAVIEPASSWVQYKLVNTAHFQTLPGQDN